MPSTATVSNSFLGIRLDDGPGTYSPGDAVCGVLFRQHHVVATNARLTISLQGRSKVKITKSTQNGNHYYRSRFSFFDSQATLQTVFDGPLHIEPRFRSSGVTAWPFAVTIPSSVDHRALIRGGSQKESFSPLTEDLPLPASFSGGRVGFSGEFDAFIEYFLLAELKVSGQGSTSTHVATKPVIIRVPREAPLVDDFMPRMKWMDWCASSHRLVPGMHDAKLSFSQKTQQAFGSKKVPTFTCRVQVEMPTIFQLENPATVPVLVRALPHWGRTSEIIQNVPQKIKLVSLNIAIVACTEVYASGTLTVHNDTARHSTSLGVGPAMMGLGKEVFIPCRADEPPLDIGELIGLRVGYDGGAGISRKYHIPYSLYPTFVAFNIKHTHRLEWSLKLSLEDKKFEMMGEHLVKLLPPAAAGWSGAQGAGSEIEPPPPFAALSESWIRPPPETEAPPPFKVGK